MKLRYNNLKAEYAHHSLASFLATKQNKRPAAAAMCRATACNNIDT
jgi:hypothetical protein